MDKIFQIGSFCFRICCKNPIPIPYNFLLFANPQKTEADYTYHLSLEKKFDLPSQRIIAKRPDLLVMENDKYESRLIGSLGGTSYYAFYREISECDAKVQIALHKTSDLLYDTVFTSMFALERQMTRRDSMILHCAYIKYRGTAILFSAPSETGKTTQAGLWEKYRGSETVNGDRALLRRIDGRWTACGWPVCGTSEICHLEDIPIHAVAMLYTLIYVLPVLVAFLCDKSRNEKKKMRLDWLFLSLFGIIFIPLPNFLYRYRDVIQSYLVLTFQINSNANLNHALAWIAFQLIFVLIIAELIVAKIRDKRAVRSAANAHAPARSGQVENARA